MAYKRKTEDVYEVVYDYGYGDGLEVLTQCSTMREAKAETKPLTLQSATTLAAPPIAPTIPITKTNTVSCSVTKTCAAYKPVPQSPAKP